MAGKCGTTGAGLSRRVRDNQRYVDVCLVGERSFTLQSSVSSGHFAMIGGVDYDGISPQVHVIHGIDNLLETPVIVSDGVQVIVVEDAPHIFTVGGNNPRPSGPSLLIFE